MKTQSFRIALGLAALLAPNIHAEAAPKTIYGEDDRIELYEAVDLRIQRFALSTVALISKDRVTLDPAAGLALLDGIPYDERFLYPLCREEKFFGQTSVADCSGALVAPDLVLTAGHCFESSDDCRQVNIVFDYRRRNANDPAKIVSLEHVYGCSEIVAREYQTSGADYAVIRLDRPALDRAPLPLDRDTPVQTGDPLLVIGHPWGLPTKIAPVGSVIAGAGQKGHFFAELDTFAGNSGSAVLNPETGAIRGVLVRGSDDFVKKRGASCFSAYRCSREECGGEEVTQVSAFASHIPDSNPRSSRPRRRSGVLD